MKIFLTIAFVFLIVCQTFSQTTLTFHDHKFEFILTVDTSESECSVTKILIQQLKDKKQLQTITPPDNTHPCKSSSKDWIFAIEDMNFDGKNDFRLLEFLPAAPNLPYLYWLYDPAKNQFNRDTSLREVTSPEFNKEKKIISSFWRDGCCKHGTDFYRYEKSKLILFERRVIGHDEHDKEYTEVWTLKNGVLTKRQD